MTIAQDYRREALELEAQHRDTVQEIQKSEIFNEAFKAQRIAQERAKYAQALEALQGRAEHSLKLRHTAVQQKLAALAEAEVERQRKLLGDQTLLSLYRDELAVLEPEKIVQAVQEAAGDWQRTLLRELASIEVQKRMQAPHAPEAVHKAHYELRNLAAKAAPEADALRQELHELRDVPAFVAALDVGQERVQLAGRLGVSAENFQMTM